MKDDFEVISYTFPNTQDITIIPISDVHLGAIGFLEKEFDTFVSDVLKMDDTYVILNGDLIDNSVANSVGDVYVPVSPSKQKDLIYEKLKPLFRANKVLCCTEGNHERRTQNQTDMYIGYDICCRANREDIYRPNACFMLIRFEDPMGKNAASRLRPCYSFAVTHGAGSTLKKFQDFGYATNTDVNVIGHTHQPIIAKNQRIVLDPQNNKVSFKDFYTVVAGSWMCFGGYALQKMYRPSSQGLQAITLSAKGKSVKITQY